MLLLLDVAVGSAPAPGLPRQTLEACLAAPCFQQPVSPLLCPKGSLSLKTWCKYRELWGPEPPSLPRTLAPLHTGPAPGGNWIGDDFSLRSSSKSASPNYGSGGYPGDTELLTTFNWDDRNVRRVFVRKVYAILMLQLSVTVSIVALFTFCEPVKGYVQSNPAWYWASYAVFFVTYLILACCSGPRRYFPWNLILLSIFTLSMSYLTGMLSSYYNTTSVLLCLGITALVCLSVTIFSFQTKFDFTSCQGVLFVMLMVLLFSGIILAILLPFQYVPWLHAIYAVLGAIVFTMFLAFDTQLLMGNRRYSLSPEEYIFGALNIYLDIVYIFSFFLQLFGSSREFQRSSRVSLYLQKEQEDL
ncbi:Fas apoptotic inhibitory molecule 2 [Chelonia mydas]|uniref:Protein lifeguard 2 n=1 Tax=Chelonia mydas TaxID=8469 RepID=M7B2B0_CHEMY|nr:Fas apoptotic inhibitory molecule 2 [Chelonia mydas]